MTVDTRLRLRVWALAALLAAGAIGCRTVTDPDPYYGPLSPPPWTIGGARPGMTQDEAEKRLGPPTSSETRYQRTTTWWGREISVTFDASGRAVEVFGDRATGADGQTIVSRGASEAEVVGLLGPGKLTSTYQSSSSGIISCGRRRTGGERRYEDATTVYIVSIYEDRLASVVAKPR